MNLEASQLLSRVTIIKIIEEQKQEIDRRIRVLRNGKTLPELKRKKVILVDDGIAMGSTIRVAISFCKKKDPHWFIVASPVSSKSISGKIKKIVDDNVILEQPDFFYAVAQVYKHWYDVSDEEVIEFLQRWKKE